MGAQSRNKTDRNNMKVIVKELLKEVLSQELATELAKTVIAHTDQRLNAIDMHLRTKMAEMDEHHKSVLSGLLRSSTPLANK